MTPDLTCPSTHQLLRSSLGYSGPNLSSDLLASLEYLSGLAHVSLTEVFKLPFFSGSSETASIEAPYMGHDIRVADRIFDKGLWDFSVVSLLLDVEVATLLDGRSVHLQKAHTVRRSQRSINGGLDGKVVMVDNRYLKANYPLLVFAKSDLGLELGVFSTVLLFATVLFPSKHTSMMRHSFPDLESKAAVSNAILEPQAIMFMAGNARFVTA
ncbi:hypothetical protein Tco_0057824 [Tanacetum coccineum]